MDEIAAAPVPITRRRGRPASGEGPALDRDRLIERLLILARDEGIASLNMRRVAGAFGVSPRLLYHHVRDKEEMLDLLGDAIVARNPPDLSSPDWEARLRSIAKTGFEGYRLYPGLPAAILSRTLRRLDLPHAAALREAIFVALADAGLTPEQADEGYVLFSLITLGSLMMVENIDAPGPELVVDEQKVRASLDMGIELLLFGIKRLAGR
jgi:TetR/AcrR family tetracycline transcriptional repressor